MDPELSGGCLKILNSDRFRVCPAARKQHQAFDGGLIVHTAQVLEAALLMSQSGFIKADKQIITTAVIYHDCAKVYDYFPAKDGADPRYEYTSHQKLIRHLPRSYAVFMSDTEGKVAEDIREQIAHCILAHHGRKEWGSPVEPLTTEANIIHMADMLSANCALDIY
jgi:3'-5' exoribonuclease